VAGGLARHCAALAAISRTAPCERSELDLI
jgi:hypothetical protein